MLCKHVIMVIASLLALLVAGCQTSTRSGLPEHISVVQVEMFGNLTMYKNLEGPLTRNIIDRVNQDPRIRAVSRDGDAVIRGEIIEVVRAPVRQTINDRAATARISIKVNFSFYDEIDRKYLIREATLSSTETSVVAGMYEVDKGEVEALAEETALYSLAGEIVRRTLGMW